MKQKLIFGCLGVVLALTDSRPANHARNVSVSFLGYTNETYA